MGKLSLLLLKPEDLRLAAFLGTAEAAISRSSSRHRLQAPAPTPSSAQPCLGSTGLHGKWLASRYNDNGIGVLVDTQASELSTRTPDEVAIGGSGGVVGVDGGDVGRVCRDASPLVKLLVSVLVRR